MLRLFYCDVRKFAYPSALKAVSTVLSRVLFSILFFAFIFADFGSNFVVKSVSSPQNIYTVEVINSDQGAFGGGTLVDIRFNIKTFDLFFVSS